jgi:hypothetical protein
MKKIWASMEEILDEAGDDDIPIDEIRKKNIRIFKAQGQHTKFHAFKTHISGKNMPDCIGCPVHCVSISMVRGVISTHVLFMPPRFRRPGL